VCEILKKVGHGFKTQNFPVNKYKFTAFALISDAL